MNAGHEGGTTRGQIEDKSGSPTPDRSIAYIPALDGIRAIAVLFVLAFHAELPVPLLHHGGMAGVDIFFVISGYLITRILLEEIRTTERVAYRRFTTRRLIRLYPALVITVVLALLPGMRWAPREYRFDLASLSALLYLTPVTSGLFDTWEGLSHTWTLGLEEYFYLVFPVTLVFLTARCSRRVIAGLLVIAGAGLLSMTVIAYGMRTDPNGIFDYFRVGGIAWGCALALVLADREHPFHAGARWLISGVALLIAGLAIAGPRPIHGLSYVLVAAATCILIVVIVSPRTLRPIQWLERRPIVYIGVISYELYLIHAPVLWIGVWATKASSLRTALWAYPVTFALAAVIHRLTAPLQANLRRRYAPRAATATPPPASAD